MNKKYSKIILATDNPHKKEKLKWIVDSISAKKVANMTKKHYKL